VIHGIIRWKPSLEREKEQELLLLSWVFPTHVVLEQMKGNNGTFAG
jgi:hypothetical protein